MFIYDGGFLLPPSTTDLAGNCAVYTVSGTLNQSVQSGDRLQSSGGWKLRPLYHGSRPQQFAVGHSNYPFGEHCRHGQQCPRRRQLRGQRIVAWRGEPGSYTFYALDDSVPSNASFTYEVDWNNDNVVDQVITGGSSVTTTHVFSDNGTKTYKVRGD